MQNNAKGGGGEVLCLEPAGIVRQEGWGTHSPPFISTGGRKWEERRKKRKKTEKRQSNLKIPSKLQES